MDELLRRRWETYRVGSRMVHGDVLPLGKGHAGLAQSERKPAEQREPGGLSWRHLAVEKPFSEQCWVRHSETVDAGPGDWGSADSERLRFSRWGGIRSCAACLNSLRIACLDSLWLVSEFVTNSFRVSVFVTNLTRFSFSEIWEEWHTLKTEIMLFIGKPKKFFFLREHGIWECGGCPCIVCSYICHCVCTVTTFSTQQDWKLYINLAQLMTTCTPVNHLRPESRKELANFVENSRRADCAGVWISSWLPYDFVYSFLTISAWLMNGRWAETNRFFFLLV